MASIKRRPDGKWRARYRDERGREHARHFERKVDAQRWLDDVSTAVTSGTYVDPARSRITVAEWAQQFLDTKVDLKATTRERYAGLLRVQVLPHWGHVALAEVTHSGIASWVADLRRSGLAPSSVRQPHRVFWLALSLAVRDGRLARNPADHVPLPRLPRMEKAFLTVDQVEQLADAAEYRAAVLFLAYTGVRFGELAALRVGRLDLERRRADIVEAVAEVSGQAIFSTPKTHQARSVPMPRSLVAELPDAVAGKSADDFVFTAPRGGVLRLQNFQHHVFDPAVRALGLDGLTDCATPLPRWPSPAAPTSRSSSRCSATPAPP